jgi:HB1, ASXL, restriction endonuclease HTH domain
MDPLQRALTANQAEIERELARAEHELAVLRARERELEELIMRARYVLGLDRMPMLPTAGGPALHVRQKLTLHEALIRILREHGNEAMTAPELADEVNRTRLYRMADGSPVEKGQIHARVHNYDHLFVREDGRIRLRTTAADKPDEQREIAIERESEQGGARAQ